MILDPITSLTIVMLPDGSIIEIDPSADDQQIASDITDFLNGEEE